MCLQSDEEILYACYKKIADKSAAKQKSVSAENDRKMISGITSGISLLLLRLDEVERISGIEIQNSVIKAKGMYVQTALVKARNPGCVSKSLERDMDRLIRAVSRHEADMIGMIRMQETGGDRIDIKEIFSKKANLNRLGSTLARDIVKDAMKDVSTSVGEKSKINLLYITETGKKYHIADCPYCRGRVLTASTKAMVENLKLAPCKCVLLMKAANEIDRSHVTAFIDESIHPIKWTEGGGKGRTGSYSYIVSWGNITSENDIHKNSIVAKGVDYMNETDHIEHLTEAAIGKVMIMLAYDYDFSGNLQIYTDNLIAVNHWTSIAKNSKLAKQFESVTVSFIPREQNTKADRLGRTKTYLCVPTETYHTIVQKCEFHDWWKKVLTQAKGMWNGSFDDKEQKRNNSYLQMWM